MLVHVFTSFKGTVGSAVAVAVEGDPAEEDVEEATLSSTATVILLQQYYLSA